MSRRNRKDLQNSGGIGQVFASWGNWLRFVATLCVASSLLLVLGIASLAILRSSPRTEIRFTDTGTTLVLVNKKPSKALFLLPASRLWANTGIKLKPGGRVRISASGHINLALHRLSMAAEEDTVPSCGWVGPEGGSQPTETRKELMRRRVLIDSRSDWGALLAYVLPDGRPKPGKLNPAPDGVCLLGADGIVANSAGQNGTLWLTVNDSVLRHDDLALSKEVYLSGSTNCTSRSKCWDRIVSNQYWDVWFDDNIGQFLVQVDFVIDQVRE